VSDEVRRERPDVNNRHLLPYGVGGDYVGARRTRRAFRLLVFACIGFTFSLYYVERYLRYELNEVHYRMALTLEDDSQRAILRNVVRRDSEAREVPTAKYVEALAYIEEDDLVLERYAEAVKLAPDKGSLLIVYGCKLFQQRQYQDARQIFREATLKATRNALPEYLQAAAIAAASESEDDFRTALALLGRANDSGEPAVFPQPQWHESLPKRGNWYEMLQRRLSDEACAPLYYLKNVVIKRAGAALEQGDFQAWDGWLLQLQQMGDRLLEAGPEDGNGVGTSPALCGLQVQKDALLMRIALRERRGAETAELATRKGKVEAAIARVQQFEAERENFVAAAEGHVTRPLGLAAQGMMLLGLAVCVGWVMSRIFRTDKNARTLRQPRGAIYLLGGWLLLVSLLLLVTGGTEIGKIQTGAHAAWYVSVSAMLLYALLFPVVLLPAPEKVCQSYLEGPEYAERLREAGRRRRKAWVSLSGRYINIVLGSYVMLLAVYFIGFRIFTGLYPTDVKLLTSGVELREIVLFNDLYQVLSS
jgi:hypothetical protein